jgi:hypothetical protein
VTLWPEGEAPPTLADLAMAAPLDDAGLVEILDTLPTRPFLAGDEGVRLCLAGAQQKREYRPAVPGLPAASPRRRCSRRQIPPPRGAARLAPEFGTGKVSRPPPLG